MIRDTEKQREVIADITALRINQNIPINHSTKYMNNEQRVSNLTITLFSMCSAHHKNPLHYIKLIESHKLKKKPIRRKSAGLTVQNEQ